MNINMKRVGECVTLEASGTPEELATYSRLAGLLPSGRTTTASDGTPMHPIASFITNLAFDAKTADTESLRRHLR